MPSYWSAINNDLTEEEWEAWGRLTPQERWRQSMKLWEIYVAMGGSLDPEYDPQSPFNNDYYPDEPPADEPQYVYLKQPGLAGPSTHQPGAQEKS
jgi:hypothetical protein